MKKPIVFLIIFTIIMGFIFWNVNIVDDNEFVCESQASPRGHFSQEDSAMYGEDTQIVITSKVYDISLSNPVSRTSSMSPSIPNSAKVITRKPLNDSDFYVGDIVCFPSQNNVGKFVCHRIIEIDGDRVFTKGDNAVGGGEVTTRDRIDSIVIGVLY